MNHSAKFISLMAGIVFLSAAGCGSKSKTPGSYYNNQEQQSVTKTEETDKLILEKETGGYVDGTSTLMNKKDQMHTSVSLNFSTDTGRRFVKTADVEFRVKDVLAGTYEVEDLTRHYQGFVASTWLENEVNSVQVVPVSPDSMLETTYYTMINTMVIRVPEAKLDSILRSFSPMIEFLDHRTVMAEDKQFELLANRLRRKRVEEMEKRIRSRTDSKGRNLGEVTDAEDMLYGRQEEADNSLIENLRLNDQIAYSTINLRIYQRQGIKREMILNDKNVEAYEPGFGYKLKQSFRSGWKGFVSLVLLLANLWVFLIIIFVVVFFILKWRKNRPRKA